MTGSKLIDSSVWLAYFFNGDCSNIIDTGEVFLVSALSLFEIKNKLLKSRAEQAKVTKCIEFFKKRSIIVPIDERIAEKAVDFALKYKLGAVDALIYTTAQQNGAVLLTLDNDFRGLCDVEVA